MAYILKDIVKKYGNRSALDGVSLSVDGDGILGVIGESGAGKTTLLRILAGLELPTSGSLMYHDHVVDERLASIIRREVTMLFQTPLFLRGDVFSNIAYGLRLREAPENEIKKTIENALEKVRLPGFETRNALKISGGEAQRVALARALVLNPKILLLDEPTSNLDPSNASIISDILKEEEKARTIVIATHDYTQIRRLAKRVVQLEEGRIIRQGDTEELFAASRYADNVFSGTARMDAGICLINVGSGLEIAAALQVNGRVFIHISPEDIIISRNYIETSARNELKGRIIAIEELGNIIRLKVDASRIFTVQITKQSLNHMELNIGMEIYISFKASSVELL